MSNPNIHPRDYNFFSEAISASRSSRRKTIGYLIVLLLYLLTAAGSYLFLENAISIGKTQIKAYDDFLQSEDTLNKTKIVLDAKAEIERLEKYTQSIEALTLELKKSSTINSDYIKQITSTIPNEVFFENISMTYNQLQIQGNGATRIRIAELLSNMQELGIFDDVHVSGINKISSGESTDEGYTFIMSCQLKEVIEDEVN